MDSKGRNFRLQIAYKQKSNVSHDPVHSIFKNLSEANEYSCGSLRLNSAQRWWSEELESLKAGCDESDLLPIRHPWLSETHDGLNLRVIVQVVDGQPSFGNIETSGDSQRLQIHISERNNDMLISFLASSLEISKKQIEIQTGPKNVKKVLRLRLEKNQIQTVSEVLKSKASNP